MRVVKADRWHKVDVPTAPATPAVAVAPRRCSVCGSPQLAPRGEMVMDGGTLARYQIVRCEGCGYDLLEPAAAALVQAS